MGGITASERAGQAEKGHKKSSFPVETAFIVSAMTN